MAEPTSPASEARQIKNFPRLKFLQQDLHSLASQMSVPLYSVGSIIVPNLQPSQKSAIHRVTRKMIASVASPAWEKQALAKAIRVVRSSPVNVRRVFEQQARRFDKLGDQPPCKCLTATKFPGVSTVIDGHVAYTPLWVPTSDIYARPNDPLPLRGSSVRSQLLSDLKKMADQIGASLPLLELMLPDSLWPETGHKLTQVRKFAKSVCQSHYVRIVDKGVGVLWAFCRHWVWGIIQQFLKSEGYTPSPKTLPQAMAFVSAELDARGWDRNTAGQLPLLYLLGKFKSLAKGKWLWRGITSLPQPLLPKKSLRIAARANTAFLRLLCQEVPCCFLAQSISEVSQWFHWLDTINARFISEVDCKDQFNNICPTDIESHLTAASKWLAKRRKWRMTDIEWSIHKDSKMLDRAGRAKATKFWYITHAQMSDTITFEMHCNNFIRAVGGLWCRHGCIPMGGSFSAQAADLHSLWQVYSNRHLLRRLGSLTVSEAGFPYWESPQGITALCQFRDNILIATTYPDTTSHPIVSTVCNLLGEAWNLDVLCECMSGPGDPCKHHCHSASTTALGFDMIRGKTGKGLAYLHPSALSSTWSLKSAPPLLSPASAYPAYLPGIMTGALSNARPWATTWAGELLSLSAWLQIALLSGYALPQVTRAAHSAVTRGLSTSPNDHTATTRYLYTVRHLLPMPHCCHLTLCAAWLRRHAHWAGDSYSSWHLDPSLSPDGTTGFWCGDWEILHLHAAKVKPSNHDCPPWETMCV